MLELRVDTDLQTALPSEIGFNFEELKTELAERLDHYNNLVVTEEGIKEAKADRAKLNKLRTAIDTRRKDIKKEYLKPYNDFEGKIKELTLLIDQPIKAIDTQLETYEEKRKQAKMEKVKEAYEETIDPFIEDIIPLDRIMDQKWLNSTTSMKKVKEDLEAWNTRVNADLLALDTVEEEYAAAVKEKYTETLDVAQAMAHRDKLKEAEEAFRAREEEKKRREEERAAREAERAAQRESALSRATTEIEHTPEITAQQEPEPTMEQPQEKRYILRLEFNVSREQAIALRKAIDQIGITYKKI